MWDDKQNETFVITYYTSCTALFPGIAQSSVFKHSSHEIVWESLEPRLQASLAPKPLPDFISNLSPQLRKIKFGSGLGTRLVTSYMDHLEGSF